MVVAVFCELRFICPAGTTIYIMAISRGNFVESVYGSALFTINFAHFPACLRRNCLVQAWQLSRFIRDSDSLSKFNRSIWRNSQRYPSTEGRGYYRLISLGQFVKEVYGIYSSFSRMR